jgi:beta-lactamase class A
MSPGLSALLESEAARFTLHAPDDAAPVGTLELEALRERKPLGVGIYAKHLRTGQEGAVRADVVFEAQSVIKLALAIRCYRLAEDGQLDLERRVPVRRSDMLGGSGVLQYVQEGIRPTVRDLVTMMIVTSDNTATETLLTRIGGVAAVNAWLAASGYTEARIAQSLLEASRFPYVLANADHASLTGDQVYALKHGDPQWAGKSREWLGSIEREVAALASRPLGEVRALAQARGLPLSFGRMTPREAGRMLESIERATAVSAESSAELRLALRRQQLGERRLPRLVEHPVGHKTGDFPPLDANDAGIVYAPSGPVVIAVFANDLGGDYDEEQDRIATIGRVVVDHFDGAAPVP